MVENNNERLYPTMVQLLYISLFSK